MKFEVYGEKPQQEKVLRLRLRHTAPTGVVLCVVDERGSTLPYGNILLITPKGVTLCHHFAVDGLPTSNGYVATTPKLAIPSPDNPDVLDFTE